MPNPRIIFSILFDWKDASINIPATFFLFSVMSFGHLTLVFRLRLLLIAFDKDTDATIGNKTDSSIVNFGCKMIENQIPPLGEIHFLFSRPFPLVCF